MRTRCMYRIAEDKKGNIILTGEDVKIPWRNWLKSGVR